MILARFMIHLGGLLVLLTLTAPIIEAQILSAELKVKGLACPYCSYGLERKLKKLPAAQSVKVLMNDDLARVQFDGKKSPRVGDFSKAVHDAGFKLGELRVTVRAKRAQLTGEPCLELPDGQILRIHSEGVGDELIHSVPEGMVVEVGGIVESMEIPDRSTHPDRIRVESYQAEKEKKRRRLRDVGN